MTKHFEPGDVAGSNLEHLDVRVEHVDGLEVVRRRKVVDSGRVALGSERRGPLPGKGGLLVDFVDRLFPAALMAKLAAEIRESPSTDDRRRPEILKLRRVGARYCSETDEQPRALQASIMIG